MRYWFLLLLCFNVYAHPIEPVLKTIFPAYYSSWMDILETTHILEKLPQDETDPEKLLDALNTELQSHWLRKKGTERSELSDEHFTPKQKAILKSAFKNLSLYPAQEPTQTEYDCAFLLGGRQAQVQTRLDTLIFHPNKNHIQIKRLYVISGYRELEPAVEPIAQKLKMLNIPQTQTNMIEQLLNEANVTVEIRYINAPRQTNTPRAKTEEELTVWKNRYGVKGTFSQEDKRILALSNQPFISYQGSMVRKILSDNFQVDIKALTPQIFRFANGYELEMIGDKADPDTMLISVILDALGREIYLDLPWLKKRAKNPNHEISLHAR